MRSIEVFFIKMQKLILMRNRETKFLYLSLSNHLKLLDFDPINERSFEKKQIG